MTMIVERGMTGGLRVETQGSARLLIIDRIDRANALDLPTVHALVDALAEADCDPEVRAIVITGAGDRFFCAGADMKAASQSTAESKSIRPANGQRSPYEMIVHNSKPVIAAINGAAAGGGFELALASDLRIAEEHATFVLPEARRGMGAHFASIMLPRLIAEGRAMEMLMLGDPIGTDDAERWGLLNRVVPKGQGRAAALAMAEAIARNAPLSVRRMKAHVRKGQGLPLIAALQLNDGPSPYDSEDRIEGFRAFAEKRNPVWKGR